MLESFKKFSNSVFVCWSTTAGENSNIRAQNAPKKGNFVDAESVRKTLEIFNLTTNAILMKLTTIMYLNESVNRKVLCARNSFFSLIASLVKRLYKLNDISGSMP